jgi:hypothetical protein
LEDRSAVVEDGVEAEPLGAIELQAGRVVLRSELLIA